MNKTTRARAMPSSATAEPQHVVVVHEQCYSPTTSTFTVLLAGLTVHPLVLTLHSPFTTSSEEESFSWYCEAADREPFSVHSRLHRVEKSLRDYGTSLYNQLFSSEGAGLPRSGHTTVRIVGSARFCGLHWELMRDPEHGPVALDPSRCLIRDVSNKRRLRSAHTFTTYPTLNVLFLTARQRGDEKDIPLRIESLAVMDSVRNHDLPLKFDLVRPGTLSALWEKLQQSKPGFYHVLHLDCHGKGGVNEAGDECNKLVLETERASYTTVSAQDIADIVDYFQIPFVFTSACRSGMSNSGIPSFAYDLFEKSNVQCVLAMSLAVLVDATARFVNEFYCAILDPKERGSVRSATGRARRFMSEKLGRQGVNGTIKREDWWLPQLFERSLSSRDEPGFFVPCTWEDAALRAGSPKDRAVVWEDSDSTTKRRNLLRTEPVNEKTFLGRDEDLRLLECKVFSQDRADNVLLLHGMMGCGKTAFLTYVSWWWCITGLVKDKFVFRVPEKAYTLNDMIWHIYRQLFNVANYDPTNASEMQITEDRRRVTEQLRKTCYVVVIDGAERLSAREVSDVSGAEVLEALSSQSGSDCESESDDGRSKPRQSPRAYEREQIARWLAELQGGRTIVLVGFCGSSDCDLMRYIEGKSNNFDLATVVRKYPSRPIGKLSDKWSVALVKQILDDNRGSSEARIRDLSSYQMLDLYAGNPLVINLVVGSLKTGDVWNNSENLQERIQTYLANSSEPMSVKTSLEFSFNLLSSPQQKALLFLAPFKGSVTEQGLRHYADALQQESKSSLIFDRRAWDSAIQMAVRWGLLTYHERTPRQDGHQAWRIHACLSVLLLRKIFRKHASMVRRTCDALPSGRGLSVLDSTDEEGALRSMLKPMHVAYWTWALQLFDLIRSSEKSSHEKGRVMIEIEFWNLKRMLNYALNEKEAFYGIVLPLYWFLAAKNDIAQRYALCKKIVEKVGTYENLADISEGNCVYRRDIPRLYHIYGMVLANHRLDKMAEAEQWYSRTRNIWGSDGNQSERAVTEHELGWVAMNKREYAKAWKHYKEAVRLSDGLGGSRTLHNMGLLAAQEGNFDNSREYLDTARILYEEQRDPRALACAYHHLAIVCAKVGHFHDADLYAKKALTVRKEQEETQQMANVHQLRGNISLQRARIEHQTSQTALRYLENAKKKYDKAMLNYNCDPGYHYGVIPEQEMLLENYGLLMGVQRRLGGSCEEKDALLKTEQNSYLLLKDGQYPKSLYNLGLTYEECGNYKDAYKYFCLAANMPSHVSQDSTEREACRRAKLAKANYLLQGRGVTRDEHSAIAIVLALRGKEGPEDPLQNLGLPAG